MYQLKMHMRRNWNKGIVGDDMWNKKDQKII